MTSKSLTGVCDSIVTSGVLDASSSASSCLGGRNTRSQTMSSLRVEQAVDRLEAEVRHPDPVRVGERQRHAQPIAVRLDDVADFFGEGGSCALALLPGGSLPDFDLPACEQPTSWRCAR